VGDDNQLQDVEQSQFDMLLACGYTKPIVYLTHKDIPGIIECVTLHTTILKVFFRGCHTLSEHYITCVGKSRVR
jgi:hypothetical protein